MRKILVIIAIVFGFTQPLTAQNQDSLSYSDSIEQTISMIVAQKVQHISDSINTALMRQKIENTSESSKRTTLQNELNKKLIDDSIRTAKLKAQIELRRGRTIGYPVTLGNDTIRLIFTNLGVSSAFDRAVRSTEKLKEISSLYIPKIDSISAVIDGSIVEVMYKDIILMSVTQADSLWVDGDQMSLAKEYSDKIEKSIVTYQKLTSVSTILKQIGFTLLSIILCLLMIKVVNGAFKSRVARFFLSKQGMWFNGWKIRDYEFMDSKRQVRTVLFAVKFTRLVVNIFLLYIVLPIIFSFFPLTKRLADTLFNWVLEPLKNIFWAFVEYLPKLFVIIVIWLITKYVVRGLKFLLNEIESEHLKIPGFYPDWAKSTYNIVRLLIYAFSFVMIFPNLPGSDSKIFQGVSVFIGIVFSLGSSSVISNLVAGIVITYMRPFRLQDHIRIGDTTGDVIEKTPFVTRIKTHKKEIVTIPNSNILSSIVINYSTTAMSEGVIFHTTITIGYDVPWRQVHEMMIQAAGRSEWILKDPSPFVLQTSLDDFYVSYQLCAYTHNPEKQASIYSELHSNIQDIFNENDVEIMSPHYRSQRDGNTTSIPPNYRPIDYQSPGFRIKKS